MPSSGERAGYEREMVVVHTCLGEPRFVAAWAEGRALTLEQAIAYALEDAP